MDKTDAKIPTRVLPGFMELLPAEQIVLNSMFDTIRRIYEQYGFVPIDTPVIERAEVLFAKVGGETAKQVYRFTKGDNDLALRFDLTVPLARYVAEHAVELTFPFRRYHLGKVYRGESPQKGRYREFYQCDIDIIGNGSLSLMNDAEIPRVIYDVFTALNIGPFVVRLSNRKLITGLMESLGISELAVEAMRVIDKFEKVGETDTRQMLVELGIVDALIAEVFGFLAINGQTQEVIGKLKALSVDNQVFQLGIAELEEVIKLLASLGMPEDSYGIDLTIARGLDYYTGTVYETVLKDNPKIGSICSGGRFDNLAEKYTVRKLPGVGISIGLTRLFSQLKDAGLLKIGASTPTKVLIASLLRDPSVSLEIATMLRTAGIPVEIYFEEAKVKTKLVYANRLGIPFVIFVGEDEIRSGLFTVKNMGTGEQVAIAKAELSSYIGKEVHY